LQGAILITTTGCVAYVNGRARNSVTLSRGEFLKFIKTRDSAYLMAQVLQQSDTTDVLDQALHQDLSPVSRQAQLDPLLCPQAYIERPDCHPKVAVPKEAVQLYTTPPPVEVSDDGDDLPPPSL
jgi:hypothetical protein